MSPAPLPSTDALVSDCVCEETPADHAMGANAAAQVAATLKALADPVRVRMLSLIAASPTGEACVCNIATVLALLPQPQPDGQETSLQQKAPPTRRRSGAGRKYPRPSTWAIPS